MTDGLCLVERNTLNTDGEMVWNDGVKLSIENVDLLCDDGTVNVLLRAEAGLGIKAYIDVIGLPEG